MVPARLTPEFIDSQIEFHASGADFYKSHGQEQMAGWSRSQVAYWQKKLAELNPVVAGEQEDRWE